MRITEADLRRAGIAIPPMPKQAKPTLVEPKVECNGWCWKFTMPIATASEANGRDWRARSKRSDAAWRVVSKTLGPNLDDVAHFAARYHVQLRPITLRFIRLGGKKLDRSNLPTALKAVEDAVAFILGADDGDARWQASWDQEPGRLVGVRVEMDLMQ